MKIQECECQEPGCAAIDADNCVRRLGDATGTLPKCTHKIMVRIRHLHLPVMSVWWTWHNLCGCAAARVCAILQSQQCACLDSLVWTLQWELLQGVLLLWVLMLPHARRLMTADRGSLCLKLPFHCQGGRFLSQQHMCMEPHAVVARP